MKISNKEGASETNLEPAIVHGEHQVYTVSTWQLYAPEEIQQIHMSPIYKIT